jgi:hypothetical protein
MLIVTFLSIASPVHVRKTDTYCGDKQAEIAYKENAISEGYRCKPETRDKGRNDCPVILDILGKGPPGPFSVRNFHV